jgi:hypothetical protein
VQGNNFADAESEEGMRDTIDMAETISHGWWLDDEKLKAFEALVRADEREACAELVYNSPPSDEYESPLKAVYNAIRARGNT